MVEPFGSRPASGPRRQLPVQVDVALAARSRSRSARTGGQGGGEFGGLRDRGGAGRRGRRPCRRRRRAAHRATPRTLAAQRPRLRQEVEDAAAVVVDDDDADRGCDVAQRGKAADVVEQAEVAGDDRGRPAAGVARRRFPMRSGRRCRWRRGCRGKHVGVARRQECLLVADRHARGGIDEVAVTMGAAQRPVEARLGDLAVGEVGSSAERAALSASSQRCGAGRSSFSRRVAQPDASSVGSARRSPPPGCSARSSRRRGRRRSGRRRSRPATSQRLAGRHLAEAEHQVWHDRAGEMLLAEQQVVGGDHVRAVVRPAAKLRGRLGEDREARGRAR